MRKRGREEREDQVIITCVRSGQGWKCQTLTKQIQRCEDNSLALVRQHDHMICM